MTDYLHGTSEPEQDRLSTMNALLNDSSLDLIDFHGVRRVIEVGCGTGHFAAGLFGRLDGDGRVVAIDASEEQLAAARAQYPWPGIEWRQGLANDLPEGEFDLAHARFLLEHVTDPQNVVNSMAKAVKPGGRVVIEDDDNDLLRMWPDARGFLTVWKAYYRTYAAMNYDPHIGRRLVQLLHGAGLNAVRIRFVLFGGCRDDPDFDGLIHVFSGCVSSAREQMLATNMCSEEELDRGLEELSSWAQHPDATLWFAVPWASGTKPVVD